MSESFGRYGRLYAALASLSIVFSFLPPYAVVRSDNGVYGDFGTVWDMASTPVGDPARAAMVLLFGMFGCLLAATVWPDVLALPAINVLCAVAVGVLLWIRPATGDPKPHLSIYGKAHLVLVIGIVVVCTIHCAHLVTRRRGTLRAHAQQAATAGEHMPAAAS